MVRLMVYQLSPEDKAHIKKIIDDPLNRKELMTAFAEMRIKKISDPAERATLEKYLENILDRPLFYQDVLEGFVKFLGFVEKGGKASYQNLMINSLDNVKNAGNIVTPVIVMQGDGVFVTPKSKVDGLYTFYAESCTIAVTVCKDSNERVIRVGMAHFDPRMDEACIREFFLNSTNGGTTDAYIFGGRYDDFWGCMFSNIDIIANSIQGVKVKFYNEDRLNMATDDAAYVDKNGKLYYGHISRLDNLKKAAQLDAWRNHIGSEIINIKHY